MRQIAYETLDVFAEKRFGGNPLAVIADGRGLSAAEMQTIAIEFNYSETTFVLPPEDPANTARVRIFTPTNELPFAGHPNVGTAFALGRQGSVFGKPAGEIMRFEELAGLVQVKLLRRDGEIDGANIRAPRPLEVIAEVDPATVAACASLHGDDVAIARHRPVVASVGVPFAVAELTSLESLARAKPVTAAFETASLKHPHPSDRFSLFLYVRTGANTVRARMFAPLNNITEDPATGSAAATLGALLSSLAPKDQSGLRLTIEQGVEMGRPSVITVTVERDGGKDSVSVGGRCVPMMRGTLAL